MLAASSLSVALVTVSCPVRRNLSLSERIVGQIIDLFIEALSAAVRELAHSPHVDEILEVVHVIPVDKVPVEMQRQAFNNPTSSCAEVPLICFGDGNVDIPVVDTVKRVQKSVDKPQA